MDLPPWLIRTIAFVFGAVWGSFFNVAIHRWPREMSVVSPPSHCPHCKTQIPWYRNVPILGWIVLRGKTACCAKPLSPRYVLVEATSAMLCWAVAERFVIGQPGSVELTDAGVTTLLYFFFAGGLLIATFVDIEWMEIPDEVSIGGTALGLATLSLRHPSPEAAEVLLGAGGAYLTVQILLVWSWERLTGRRGMGEGDSKFLMFIGAFLGWKGALFALVAGALQGMLFVIFATVVDRSRGAEPEPAEDREPEDDPDKWVSPAPLEVRDGTKASLSEAGRRLEVEDAHGRLLWDYLAVEKSGDPLRRALPFGPFLALAALEFLFFGDRLIDAYLELFL